MYNVRTLVQQTAAISLALGQSATYCRSAVAPIAAHHSARETVDMATPSQQRTQSRVAVAQMTSTGSQPDNFRTCAHLAEQASQAGCSMLYLPECCSFIGESAEETVRHATPLDGPVLRRFRDLASELGIWLSIGGFQETSDDPGRLYNTHIVLNAAGQIVAKYRKIHLFDVEVRDGPILMESRSTKPGSEVVHCDTPAGHLGLMTCYDLRFPWLSDRLRGQGADILTYPSAFTVKTGEAHWEVLLRARAIETQCYVIAAAQAGQHNSKRQSYGHALIIDPWGTIVGKLDDRLATGIAIADVDMQRLQDVQMRMPIWDHRRAAKQFCGEPD